MFDRYNFTVKEDEPLEKEVAIDPELLGKAYEKFNAIRLDNFDEYKKALKSGKKGDENKRHPKNVYSLKEGENLWFSKEPCNVPRNGIAIDCSLRLSVSSLKLSTDS